MNTLYLETRNLKVPFRYISLLSWQHKLLVYVFISLRCLLPEAATRVELFFQKIVLKNFVNFIGKHLCWSLFLIKLQAWHLFWRTSANDCFCTILAPLNVTYLFYFIFSTFFLIITTAIFNISNVCFWFQFDRLRRILLSHFHWSHFHRCSFLFPCFFCFSQFCFIFSCRCS